MITPTDHAATLKRNAARRQSLVSELAALDSSAEGRQFNSSEAHRENEIREEIATLDRRSEVLLDTMPSGANIDRSATFQTGTNDKAAADFLRSAKVGDSATFSLPLERRAAMLTTTAAGTVPVKTFDEVIASRINLSGLVEAGLRIVNTGSGEDLTVPMTLTRPVAGIVAEGAAIPISDGTLQSKTLKAYKYSLISQVSYELAMDNTADVVNYVGTVAGDAIDLALEDHLVNGNGTSQPEGIVANGDVGMTLAAAGTITADEVVDAFYSLAQAHRSNAVWLFSDQMAQAIRKLKDGEGQFLWQPSMQLGQPDTLMGRPVITGTSAPEFSDTAAARVGAFFNPEAVMLRIAGGVDVERSTEFGFQNDLLSLKVRMRADSKIVDASGVSVIANP